MLARKEERLGLFDLVSLRYYWWLQARKIREAEDACDENSPAYQFDEEVLWLVRNDKEMEHRYRRWVVAARKRAHMLDHSWSRTVKDFIHRRTVLDSETLEGVVGSTDPDELALISMDNRFFQEAGRFVRHYGGVAPARFLASMFSVRAQYGKPIEELVVSQGFHSVDSRFVTEYFPAKRKEVSFWSAPSFYELSFPERSSVDQILRSLDLFGLRPVDSYELIERFGKRAPFYLSPGRERSVYALDDKVEIDGSWLVPRLRFQKTEKKPQKWDSYSETSHLELVDCGLPWQSDSVVWAAHK